MKKLVKSLVFWSFLCGVLVFGFGACASETILGIGSKLAIAWGCLYCAHLFISRERNKYGEQGVENLVGAWIGEWFKARFKNSEFVKALFN